MASLSEKALDVCVFTLCECFGIAFAFDAVEIVRRAGGLSSGLPSESIQSGIIAVALIVMGAMFPWVRRHVSAKKKATLLAASIISTAAIDRILGGNPRFRIAAIAAFCLALVITAIRYVVKIRRDLDAYVMPRSMSQKQAVALREFLSSHPAYPITVKFNPQDQEAKQYAEQIFNALQETRWSVDSSTAINEQPMVAQGLAIYGWGAKGRPYQAPKDDPVLILQEAFGAANIQVNIGQSMAPGEYKSFVLVGPRPLMIGPLKQPLLSRLGQWLQVLGYRTHAILLRPLAGAFIRLTFQRRATRC